MLNRFKKLLGRRLSRKPPEGDPPASSGAPSTAPASRAVSSGPPAPPDPPVEPPRIRLSDIDPDAVKIVRRLARHGHTAYLVGGCVRDLLLGRKPKDFDISTSAVPRQVKSLFRNSRIIGRRFQLVHVFFRNDPSHRGEKILEIATFRATQEAADAEDDLLIRRDNVFGTPEEDARRRDFTVNSLFYDLEQEQVIDHADGLPDLRARLLRTIGDPDIRLREDPVRILRAVKFAARLSFRIDPATLAAMRRHREEIPRCAAPRILEELLRMLRSGTAIDAFGLLGESRVLEVLLPEIDAALGANPGLVDLYRGVLGEFDRRVLEGEDLPTAVLLASLFLPMIPWQANPAAAATDLQAALADLVGPVTERLRIPRRDRDEIRRILLSIRKMVPGYRAKRFSRTTLARRRYFPMLLQVFAIHCRAAGRWGAAVREWAGLRERLSSEGSVEAPAEQPRRRRAGRGRRGRDASAGRPPSAEPRSRRRRRRPAGAASGERHGPGSG